MSCSRFPQVFMVVLTVAAAMLAFLISSLCHAKSVVVLMGDSQAFLLQHDLKPLVEADGYEFKAEVVPGSSVIQWATGLDPQWARIRRAKPTLVLVALGSNDACMGARVVANEPPFLDRFLTKVRRAGGTLVWWGPPAIGGPGSQLPQATAGLEAFVQMVRGRRGVVFLDARPRSIHLWPDKLHCSRPQHARDKSDGCKTWADWAWRKSKEANEKDLLDGG